MSVPRSGRFAALVVFAALLAVVYGQQNVPSPVFRSGTELVQIEVKVSDAAGTPVSGLDRSDFTVSEGTRKLPVVAVDELAGWKQASASPAEARLQQMTGLAIQAGPDPAVAARARSAIRAFVDRVPPNVMVSVNSTPFTTDRDAMLGALASVPPATGRNPRAEVQDLILLVRRLSTFPGRRIAVLFAPRFTIDDDTRQLVRTLEREAQQHRVRFYPVDVRGLVGTDEQTMTRGNLDTEVAGISIEKLLSTSLARPQDTELGVLAQLTGGRALTGDNRLETVFDLALADAPNYRISLSPAGFNPQNLIIRVKRTNVTVTQAGWTRREVHHQQARVAIREQPRQQPEQQPSQHIQSTATHAADIRVVNMHGDVTLTTVKAARTAVRATSPDRPLRREDVLVTRDGGALHIEARPPDRTPIHIAVDIPYHGAVEVRAAGTIEVSGLVWRANFAAVNGRVLLRVPWETTSLDIEAKARPESLTVARALPVAETAKKDGAWLLRDRHPRGKVTYGAISLKAGTLQQLVLEDKPIPAESPVKLPWHAPHLLREMVAPRAVPASTAKDPQTGDSAATFRSDVRMVNLSVSVTGAEGEPAAGLAQTDFEVVEQGVRQQVAALQAVEEPFHLALLLDLSVTTFNKREEMQNAARRFVASMRPLDRIAIYALAGNLFWELSPFTNDRSLLLNRIGQLPPSSGATPLFDAIVTSLAHEFPGIDGSRKALVILTDGLENRMDMGSRQPPPGVRTDAGLPSRVSSSDLQSLINRSDTLLFPILVLERTATTSREMARAAEVRDYFVRLAERTGGRSIVTASLDSLDEVFARLAQDLRSVYSLAYYPSNQSFDGSWRNVKVTVKRPGVTVRGRHGYFGR